MRERFEILLVLLVWWIHSLFSLSLSFVVVVVCVMRVRKSEEMKKKKKKKEKVRAYNNTPASSVLPT